MIVSALCALVLVQSNAPTHSKIEEILRKPLDERPAAVSTLLSSVTTPLCEIDEKDSSLTKTTFLWSGKAAAVGVIGDFADKWSSQQMIRVEGTDLWYRTYSLPSDMSFYYRLAHRDDAPKLDELDDWIYKDEFGSGDPLNPQGITIGKDRRFSFAYLPNSSKPVEFTDEPANKGTFLPSRTSSYQIESPTLGKHRVWLYKSANFDASKPCNLVVFIDGSGVFQLIDSIRMLDNMVGKHDLGQTIGIYTDSPNRDRDLSCSDEYLKFLITDVIGWVATDNKVRFDPKRTVISGRSLGGLLAAYAAWKRPDVFGGAMMQSPSLWWHPKGEPSDWLTRQFAIAKDVRGRYFVAPGVFEKTAADKTATGIYHSSRWFTDVLTAKGMDVKLRVVSGGHDPLCWQASMPDGLKWLLGAG